MKKETLIPTETVNPRTKKLDVSSPRQIARLINAEDFNAARAVQKAGPAIAKAVDLAAKTFLAGHKIIFIGAGTSGRLVSWLFYDRAVKGGAQFCFQSAAHQLEKQDGRVTAVLARAAPSSPMRRRNMTRPTMRVGACSRS